MNLFFQNLNGESIRRFKVLILKQSNQKFNGGCIVFLNLFSIVTVNGLKQIKKKMHRLEPKYSTYNL